MKTIVILLFGFFASCSQSNEITDILEDQEIIIVDDKLPILFSECDTTPEIHFAGEQPDTVIYMRVDSVISKGKPECIHEWRNNKPYFLEEKRTKSETVSKKKYIRVCAKCIRQEVFFEDSIMLNKTLEPCE